MVYGGVILESSNPSEPENNPSIYPPPGWLQSSYDPWINKPDADETMGEHTSETEQIPETRLTEGELIGFALKYGYIEPDDIDFDSGYSNARKGIVPFIEKRDENPNEVFAEWERLSIEAKKRKM